MTVIASIGSPPYLARIPQLWLKAPGLPLPPPIRSMELESVGLGGAAAFREVRVQSVVVEFLLTHVDVLFSDTFTSAGLDPAGMLIPPPGVLATASSLSGPQREGRWAPALSLPTKAGPPSRLFEDPAPASPSPPHPSHFSSYAQDPHFLARTSVFFHPL